MRSDFAAFILTHGRPDDVITYKALMGAGYTGPLFIVVDDEDPTAERYRQRFGAERVIVFEKKATASRTDEANNFDDRRVIVHARNVSFDLARRLGFRYFIQLDDDYNSFLLRDHPTNGNGRPRAYLIRNMDAVLEAMVRFIETTPALTLAMSQGGDHIGGFDGIEMKRKAMNSFVCSTDRAFLFLGAVNEDVNTYVHIGSKGGLFFTFTGLQLNQEQTQSRGGGMTDIYLDGGTYTKSFYTVMFSPSCVKIGMMGWRSKRFHHMIDWDAAVPKIVPGRYRKEDA